MNSRNKSRKYIPRPLGCEAVHRKKRAMKILFFLLGTAGFLFLNFVLYNVTAI